MKTLNALTVDLEPWLSRLYELHPERKVEEVTLLRPCLELLDMFERQDVETTFFVLGLVYDRYPSLIDEIASRGHEIAFHGYYHDIRLHLKQHIALSQTFLSRYNVKGFRSPRMNITLSDIECLSQACFSYDSSTYGPFFPLTKVGNLWEVRVSTYPLKVRTRSFFVPRSFTQSLRNLEIPFGSGMMMGMLGTKIFQHLIRKLNKKDMPVILFIHQWQVSDFPKLITNIPTSRWYNLLKNFSIRDLYSVMRLHIGGLENILRQHTFVSIKTLLKETAHYMQDNKTTLECD